MQIQYSKQALKFLKKQSALIQRRIISSVERLPAGDVRKLTGSEDIYRLRVGDYRILLNKDGQILFVLKIDSRGQVYKR